MTRRNAGTSAGHEGDQPTVKILIVDDDEAMRLTLSDLMASLGLSVQTAKSGTEALIVLNQQPAELDIVLTDLMMPGYTGLDILKAVRARSEHILVVIMTGYASIESAVEAIRAGAYDYIAKPFTLGEAEILIRNAMERIRLQKENARLTGELQDLSQKVSQLQDGGHETRRLQREIKDEVHALGAKLDNLYERLQVPAGRR